MPDSNITKKALAMAMKELMEQIPFSKISVSDICEKCGMNRKSFYYHFKDKYDLVNWIFDVEFFRLSMSGTTICQTGRGVFWRTAVSIFTKTSHFTERHCRLKGRILL